MMTICLGHGYIANFPSGTNKETEAKLDNVELQIDYTSLRLYCGSTLGNTPY